MPEDVTEFDRRNFSGTVITKEWTPALDGRQFRMFTGRISILQDTEIVGFNVTDRESNWLARVEGPTQSYNLLGCQIRGVIVHPADVAPPGGGTDRLVVP